MTEESKIARRTISLDAQLNEEMATHSGENWSSVAAGAFRQRLAEIKKQKNTNNKNIMKVIERLRETQREEASVDKQEGLKNGREWAEEVATTGELRRLSRLKEDERQWEYVIADKDWLAREIEGAPVHQVGFGAYTSEEFWQGVFGEEVPELTRELLEGFAEGALNVWEEVKDQL